MPKLLRCEILKAVNERKQSQERLLIYHKNQHSDKIKRKIKRKIQQKYQSEQKNKLQVKFKFD